MPRHAAATDGVDEVPDLAAQEAERREIRKSYRTLNQHIKGACAPCSWTRVCLTRGRP